MAVFRNAEKSDLEKIFNLINDVFRKNYSPTMQNEFPSLFEESNLDRVFIALENEKIVSHMGYQVCDYKSEEGKSKISFLGGVATAIESRGKGYANALLKLAESKMEEEMIDICLISGNRGLYLRNGYNEVSSTNFYAVPAIENENIEIRKYDKPSFSIIKEIYQNEKKRFVRKDNNFKRWLEIDSRLEDNAPNSVKVCQFGKTYIVYEKKIPKAYFSFRGNLKYTIEYAGDRESLMKGAELFKSKSEIDFSFCIPQFDEGFVEKAENRNWIIKEETFFPPYHTIKVFNKNKKISDLILPGFNYV